MTNKKITELPVATTVAPGDIFLVVQGGVTKQVDPDIAINALIGDPASATGAALGATYAPLTDAVTKSDLRTILCAGDSITYGNQDYSGISWPGLLATMLGTGVTVVNDGQSGWTSTEVGIRQGGISVTVGAFTLPADTSQATVTVISPIADFRPVGVNIYPSWVGTIAGVAVRLRHHIATGDTPSGAFTIERLTSGSGTLAVASGSTFQGTDDAAYYGTVAVIAVGRNNTATPQNVLNDVAAMVAKLSPTAKRFLVLAVLPTTGETTGTSGATLVSEINSGLAAAYGARYVDTAAYLMNSGLAFNGLTATTADTNAISGGTIPPSLKIGDGVHPNQYGYRAMANAVINQLVALGWTVDKRTPMPAITPNMPTDYAYRWRVADLSALAENASVSTWPSNYSSASSLALTQTTTTAQPTVYTAADGKRYVKFDGVAQELKLSLASIAQPVSFLIRGKLRTLNASNGLVWSSGSPGAVAAVTSAGLLQVNAGSTVNTPTGEVVAGTNFTAVIVLNGASSFQQIGGNAAVTGALGTNGFVTYVRIGYAYSGGSVWAPLDLEEIVLYNRALTQAEAAAAHTWFSANE